VPPDQVSLYYRLADVSVDPVRDDEAARGRSPLKLFESWASEVPFITADVGDRRNLMEAQDEGAAAGLLARPGDPDSLAEAIQRVLMTPTLASQLRQAGRERLPAFTWERLARRLERLYLGEGDLPA
jgi:glycosyltransferase involved in cell wall biosynthesis